MTAVAFVVVQWTSSGTILRERAGGKMAEKLKAVEAERARQRMSEAAKVGAPGCGNIFTP